eukprot:scaffold21209_cov43-Phaeocystis_antarctica.AAC.2
MDSTACSQLASRAAAAVALAVACAAAAGSRLGFHTSVRGCGKSAIRTLHPNPALNTTMSAPVAAAMMMARTACLARAPRMVPAVRRAAPR